MSKTFKHPLARKATVAKLHAREGGEKDLLIVVTTLELDAAAEGFNAKNVERLNDAAKTFLAEAKDLAGYVLVNRAKEWKS
jgi:predicted lipoprotein with Yx(FWY)xxD motif